jgi:hypothetical protein
MTLYMEYLLGRLLDTTEYTSIRTRAARLLGEELHTRGIPACAVLFIGCDE